MLAHALGTKDSAYCLENTERLLAVPKLDASSTSPAEVILFSMLYDTLATFASGDLTKYPTVKSWYLKSLDTAWAKAGIEQAAAQTTVQPVEPSPAQGKVEKVFVEKMNDAARMKIPTPGEKM